MPSGAAACCSATPPACSAAEADGLEAAGEAWALIDLARHCATREDADVAVAAARERRGPRRWPARLRPLGMLAALAARDSGPGPPALGAAGRAGTHVADAAA